MSDGQKAIIVLCMLAIMFIGVFALFNLGSGFGSSFDVSFKGSGINIFWTILLRVIIAPLLIIMPVWVIYHIIRGD